MRRGPRGEPAPGTGDRLKFADAIEKRTVHLVFVALLVAAAYANSLPNGFAFDDNLLFVGNPSVHGFSAENLRNVFGAVPNGLEYLPVRDLTYMADYSAWGLDPFGYHLSNVAWYVLACWALYFFLVELLSGRMPGAAATAFLATALFAVHPVHVEVVAGISQRKDLVSAAFLFPCLSFYLAFRRKGKASLYAASLAFCLLSLLSKHTAVIVPFLLFLLEFLHVPAEGDRPAGKALRLAPFFAVAAGVALLNYSIMEEGGVFRRPIHEGAWIRIDFAVRALYRYLALAVIPYPLTVRHSFSYGHVLFSVPAPVLVAGIAAGMFLAYRWRARRMVLSLAVSWFAVTLAPSLGFASSHHLLSERYLFIPSAGFCLLAGDAASRALREGSGSLKAAAAFLGGAVFLVFAWLTVGQNALWKNDATLFADALRHEPENADLYYLVGRVYFDEERYVDAFSSFDAGRALAPHLADYGFYRALYLYRKGDYESALATLRETSSRANLDILDIHQLFGMTYEKLGRIREAEESYRKAVDSNLSIASYYYTRPMARASLRALRR